MSFISVVMFFLSLFFFYLATAEKDSGDYYLCACLHELQMWCVVSVVILFLFLDLNNIKILTRTFVNIKNNFGVV